MNSFICEVKFCEKSGNYSIEFFDEFSGEILSYKDENCLEDCLIDLYDFERECYNKFVTSNFDVIKIRVKDVMFGM